MHVVWLRVAETDDVELVADLDDATLDAAGDDRATTRDREHVFDRHQERLVELAHRLRDERVTRVHQLLDRLHAVLATPRPRAP